MSGVVDSGRQIGHGNIDANDPKPIREADMKSAYISRLD